MHLHSQVIPSTFIVNDTVTYADGHSENIYNSFTNESNANQVEWNDMSSSLPDTYDAPNPEDNLRDLMGAEEYADLMEETDAALFNLTADYAPSDFSGDPYAISENETDIADSISDKKQRYVYKDYFRTECRRSFSSCMDC